jgi:hypothetical protein
VPEREPGDVELPGRGPEDGERRARPAPASLLNIPLRGFEDRHRHLTIPVLSSRNCAAKGCRPGAVADTSSVILHGRRICRPKPLCEQCVVRDECDYYRTVVARERGRGAGGRRKAPPKPPTRKAGAAKRVRTPRR